MIFGRFTSAMQNFMRPPKEDTQERLQLLSDTIARGEQLQDLDRNAGWQHFVREMTIRYGGLSVKLRGAKTIEEVRQTQAQMEELEFVLNFVKNAVDELETARAELKELMSVEEEVV